MRGPTLKAVTVGRDNNLNLIRMLLASSVLVSHSVPLTEGAAGTEPLVPLLHISLGNVAVYGFFFISGFLVTRSLDQRNNLSAYFSARALRIFPGLAVVLLLSVMVLGPLVTTLPFSQYATSPKTWIYLPAGVTLFHLQHYLPGVFTGNIYPGAVNGSLWTLPYEFGCYIIVGLLWLAGVFRAKWNIRRAVGYFVASAMIIVLAEKYASAIRLAETVFIFCFFAGSLAHFLRDRIVLNGKAALALLSAVMLVNYFLPFQVLLCMAYFYGLLCAAYLRSEVLLHYNRLGDYSYGMYIYAFPVEQTLVHLKPGISAVELVPLAMGITICLAILSWHFIEQPALTLKAPRLKAEPQAQ
jgi:peptidoglycan/LPS O-acetylase OafA/YrhL